MMENVRPSLEKLRPLLNGVLTTSECPGLPVVRGKVRDIYDLGEYLGLVATDRLSAFDRAITTIPGKGAVLSGLSAWWFGRVEDIVPHHLRCCPHPNLSVVEKCQTPPG
jgi:phosphoribosylaminoimidazole-succinocarboxamide synthase